MRAEAQQYIDRIDAALALLRQSLDWDRALRRLDELNARVEDPTLWDNAKQAQDVMRERTRLDSAIGATRAIEGEKTDTAELIEMAEAEGDESMVDEAVAALKALAEKGGVVGATCITSFLKTGANSTINDYVDAIDDLVELIGIDHVGIGTDFTQDQPKAFFDWIFSQQGTKLQDRAIAYPDPVVHPEGMETPDKFFNIALALSARGYGAQDVRKVLGGNWLRLFKQVWGE